jgi:predicted O-methyltransferase YrrM
MSIPASEPTTAEAVQEWTELHTRSSDRFGHIARSYEQHRNEHGCYGTYPFQNGPLLGTLAASVRPKKMLEVGCGLGYSGLWLAWGAGPLAVLDTIEVDDHHIEIALEHFKSEELADHINIMRGQASAVLPGLKEAYDLICFDTDPDESLPGLAHFERLLRRGGLLISANLFLGQFAPDLPGLDKAAEYREQILNSERWLTTYLPDGTALSVRR